MTREAIMELVAALRPRYRQASKGEKTVMLNEFCTNTGYHRKAAIRLIQSPPPPGGQTRRRAHPPRYGSLALRFALQLPWQVSGYICPQRHTPFSHDGCGSRQRSWRSPSPPNPSPREDMGEGRASSAMPSPVRLRTRGFQCHQDSAPPFAESCLRFA